VTRPRTDSSRTGSSRTGSSLGTSGRAGRPATYRLANAGGRLRVAVTALVFVLSLFGARLFQLQVADASVRAAEARQARVQTQALPAARGDITDVNGRPLATTVAAYLVAADPKLTAPYAGQFAAALAPVLRTSAPALLAKLAKPRTRYVVLARQIDPAARAGVDAAVSAVRTRVQAAQRAAGQPLTVVDGIIVSNDPRRVYPAGPVAGNVVGFVGAGQGDGQVQALAGLELSAGRLLAGTDGTRTYEAGMGEAIPSGANRTVPAVDGTDIRLTIDSDLQWRVQQSLAAGVKATGSQYGMAVVMEVGTGRIAALAAAPSVDPTDPAAVAATDRNDAPLQRVYEPGSVQKVLTMSALLDAGLVTPTTAVTVPGSVRIGADTVHDDSPHGTWHLTAAGVIAASSNVGMLTLAKKLPKDRLEGYLRAFGLGSRTGAVPGGVESAGQLAPSSTWPEVQRATIAFGQGLSVNAVQMAAAVAAVANGGVYVQPTVVAGTTTPDGVFHPAAAPVTRRVVSAPAAAATVAMLQGTARAGGTAPKAAIPGFPVAGKTGTAQYSGQGITYADGIYTTSFAGFAPAAGPRYVTYVVMHDPKQGKSGGTTAMPVWRDITTFLLQRYPPATVAAPLPVFPIWAGKPYS